MRRPVPTGNAAPQLDSLRHRTQKPRMLSHRLRSDFHLAIVVLFCAITVVGVTPFAIYRFIAGQPVIGVVDLVLVACIGGSAVHAWRTGRSRGAAVFASVTYSFGCVVIAHLAGLAGLLWVYPVLVANFLLVGRRLALVNSVLVIAGITASDAALADTLQKSMFICTSGVVSLFSFVFASRAEIQRHQLEAIAMRDPLTGAINRRGMDAELRVAMASALRSVTPLGLLVFDLDHFKQVNDTHGHEAGDDVLVQVANVVRHTTRMDDRFFRIGGEEFGLLLPGANATSLLNVAEKLRTAVEREVRCHGRSVTISIGASPFRPGDSVAEWLARADAAMYEAKRNGRNRTVLSDPLAAD
jgi:diguanylate cyclase